jgi:hypothetical protein
MTLDFFQSQSRQGIEVNRGFCSPKSPATRMKRSEIREYLFFTPVYPAEPFFLGV